MSSQERDIDVGATRPRIDRRRILRFALGLVGISLAATSRLDEAEAARRGFSGPSLPATSNSGKSWGVDVRSDPYTAIGYRTYELPNLPAGSVLFTNLVGDDIFLEIEGGPSNDPLYFLQPKTYTFGTPRTVRFRVKQHLSGNPPFFGPWGEVTLA